jgi:signal transduction histidine kinase
LLLDITEREQAILREQQARAEYTLQLIASQEAERARIAGELHDSLGQTLSIIKNHAQLALLRRKLDAHVREQLGAVCDTTSQAIAELRRISRDLHPYQLDHLGLTRALEALIESADDASGIIFNKKFDAADDVFSRDAATNLYRIVQEGVNNILKYSCAKNARVTLERDVHDVQLTIEDDGCGFKANHTGKGMGLKNIAERARILGGELKLDSAPGKGTRLEITIPISAGPE